MRQLFFKRSFVLVMKGLADADANVRREALEAVGTLHFGHAFDPLQRIFRASPDPNVRKRALQSIEREQTEAKLLRSKAEKDLAKREEETAAQMATDMISPLTSFERAGVALLLRNEPTKEAMPPNEDGEEQQTRKINIKKRRENAQRKW